MKLKLIGGVRSIFQRNDLKNLNQSICQEKLQAQGPPELLQKFCVVEARARRPRRLPLAPSLNEKSVAGSGLVSCG